MNSDASLAQQGQEISAGSSHGYASSESESRRTASASGKKRASRAGTRSVTTLSAAQLERKRANDREAQRAIRQRTKDHIETLEKSISELRSTQESTERIALAAQQRNRELEEENAYLRSRLAEAGYSAVLPTDVTRSVGAPLNLSIPTQAPPGGITVPLTNTATHRSNSLSTPSNLSVVSSQDPSASRHGSFQSQQQQASYGPGASSPPNPTGGRSPMSGMTTWRSHDGTVAVPPGAPSMAHMQDAAQHSPASTYSHPTPAPAYQYGLGQEQTRSQSYPPNSTIPPGASAQQQFASPSAPPLAPASQTVPTASYHPPISQASVNAPAAYVGIGQQGAVGFGQSMQHTSYPQTPTVAQHAYPPSQHTQGYVQPPYNPPPASYAPTSLQTQASMGGYASNEPMQPPPVHGAAYPLPPTEQQYSQAQTHPPLVYRDDSAGRSYSMPHYTSG